MAAVLGDDARRRRRFDVGAGVGRRHVGVGQSAAGGAPLLCPAAEEKNPPIRITANKKKNTQHKKKTRPMACGPSPLFGTAERWSDDLEAGPAWLACLFRDCAAAGLD